MNHPHICVLYDIGNLDGVGGYMVMEYLEGETLAARIQKGALPLDQALNFVIQIAGALDRAHRSGVTHRDVKPQNIMLTRDGVKVLDFGLAKSVANKPGLTEETLTQTLAAEGTRPGTILGTVAYTCRPNKPRARTSMSALTYFAAHPAKVRQVALF